MALPHFSELRERARRSLDAVQNPKKVILLHTGATMLLSLLLMLVDYLLEQQIGTTGGLSGIGTRSILETARSVLQLVSGIVLPFWQMGYLYYTLKVAQGNDVGYAGLLQGFHRFGAVLRLKLLMAGIVFLVMVASSYLSSSIFMLTPWSEPLLQAIIPMFSGEMDANAMMDIYESIPLSAVAPMMVIFLVSFIALIIPVLYRYRMAELWLLDHPNHGAFASVRNSRRMMRGNCIAVFKIVCIPRFHRGSFLHKWQKSRHGCAVKVNSVPLHAVWRVVCRGCTELFEYSRRPAEVSSSLRQM